MLYPEICYPLYSTKEYVPLWQPISLPILISSLSNEFFKFFIQHLTFALSLPRHRHLLKYTQSPSHLKEVASCFHFFSFICQVLGLKSSLWLLMLVDLILWCKYQNSWEKNIHLFSLKKITKSKFLTSSHTRLSSSFIQTLILTPLWKILIHEVRVWESHF